MLMEMVLLLLLIYLLLLELKVIVGHSVVVLDQVHLWILDWQRTSDGRSRRCLSLPPQLFVLGFQFPDLVLEAILGERRRRDDDVNQLNIIPDSVVSSSPFIRVNAVLHVLRDQSRQSVHTLIVRLQFPVFALQLLRLMGIYQIRD